METLIRLIGMSTAGQCGGLYTRWPVISRPGGNCTVSMADSLRTKEPGRAPVPVDFAGIRTTGQGVLIYRTRKSWPLAFRFTYSKPCTILKFLSRAALQPDDFENPTIRSRCLMWRKEEAKPQAAPQAPAPSTVSLQPATVSAPASAPVNAATSATLPVSPRATACITQGIRIKGEITGKEDLFIDGTLEGKLDLGNASVTVGPNGKVKADVSAREVVVRGQLDGKIDGTERVQLWNSGRVTGEVRTA